MSEEIDINFHALSNGGRVEAEMDADLGDQLREFFTVEMLQGTQEPMPDGRTRYVFHVSDPDKARALWNALAGLKKARVTSLN